MKIGIGAFLTDRSIRPDTIARAVEERGFESLLLPEHSHIPTSRESPYPGGGRHAGLLRADRVAVPGARRGRGGDGPDHAGDRRDPPPPTAT